MHTRAQRDSDPEYLRFRRRSVVLAVWMTVFVCVLVLVYVLTSWDRPHRTEIVVLSGFAITSVLAIVAVRADRVVETRWREPFFAVWSTLDVVIVVLLALADGGASSPLVVTLFLPLVFAALCYPLEVAALVSVATIAGCVVLGFADPSGRVHELVYLTGCLLVAAIMCVWQAYTLDNQRHELAAASRTDFLTGCLNRRGFDERLAGEIARASRDSEPLALVLFDLDGFKQVNDARGHAAGDELLRWVVQRSAELLRPTDALGRLGGDEFALLLAGVDETAARDVASRLVDALQAHAPVSAGVATFPADGQDGDALLRIADVELYANKHGLTLDDDASAAATL